MANRQRAALAQKARVQRRESAEAQGDKFHPASDYARNKRECIKAYEAHKAEQVMGTLIATHW